MNSNGAIAQDVMKDDGSHQKIDTEDIIHDVFQNEAYLKSSPYLNDDVKRDLNHSHEEEDTVTSRRTKKHHERTRERSPSNYSHSSHAGKKRNLGHIKRSSSREPVKRAHSGRLKDSDRHRDKTIVSDYERGRDKDRYKRKDKEQDKLRSKLREKFKDKERGDNLTGGKDDMERGSSPQVNRHQKKDKEKERYKDRDRGRDKKRHRDHDYRSQRYHDDTNHSERENSIRTHHRRYHKEVSPNGNYYEPRSKKDYHRSERSASRYHENRRPFTKEIDRGTDLDRQSNKSKANPPEASKRTWRFDSPPRPETQTNPTSGFSNGLGLTHTALVPSISQELPNPTTNFSASVITSTDPGNASQNNMEQTSSPGNFTTMASSIGLDANLTKGARELYVGNLPPGIDVTKLLEFLNAAMLALKANTMPGSSCTKGWISTDGHYAFVELRTLEEASNGMQLNGLNFLGHGLRIGRPKTYTSELVALTPQPTAVALDSSYLSQGIAGVKSGMEAVAELSQNADLTTAAQKAAKMVAYNLGYSNLSLVNKIDRMCIIGLPPELSEEKVKSLVTSFGNVKFFQLLIKEDGQSSGVCICDFQDYESQQQAIEILTQNTPYTIMKASEAIEKGPLADFVRLQIQSEDPLLKPQVATKVIMLCNLVTRDDLLDENEYQDIFEDVRCECEMFGTVNSLVIPRPVRGFDETEVDQSDVGYAFVEFETTEIAAKARKALSGRKFSTRTVEAHYFSEVRYAQSDFKNPRPNFDKADSSLYNPELQSKLEVTVQEESFTGPADVSNQCTS